MMGSSARQEEDSSATPGLSDFQNGRKNNRASSTRSPPPPAFQPINDLDPESSVSAGEQELDIQSISSADASSVEEVQPRRQNKSLGKKKLFVQISRTEADDLHEYEDCTTGSERVRRVLWEIPPIKRQIAYQVQFDDFHDEAVRIFPFLCHHISYILSSSSGGIQCVCRNAA
jgi:hypothetical protein